MEETGGLALVGGRGLCDGRGGGEFWRGLVFGCVWDGLAFLFILVDGAYYTFENGLWSVGRCGELSRAKRDVQVYTYTMLIVGVGKGDHETIWEADTLLFQSPTVLAFEDRKITNYLMTSSWVTTSMPTSDTLILRAPERILSFPLACLESRLRVSCNAVMALEELLTSAW